MFPHLWNVNEPEHDFVKWEMKREVEEFFFSFSVPRVNQKLQRRQLGETVLILPLALALKCIYNVLINHYMVQPATEYSHITFTLRQQWFLLRSQKPFCLYFSPAFPLLCRDTETEWKLLLCKSIIIYYTDRGLVFNTKTHKSSAVYSKNNWGVFWGVFFVVVFFIFIYINNHSFLKPLNSRVRKPLL